MSLPGGVKGIRRSGARFYAPRAVKSERPCKCQRYRNVARQLRSLLRRFCNLVLQSFIATRENSQASDVDRGPPLPNRPAPPASCASARTSAGQANAIAMSTIRQYVDQLAAATRWTYRATRESTSEAAAWSAI